MKKIFITAIFSLISLSVFSQYNRRDSNRIGIAVGMNQFTMNTDNFKTNPGTGWNAGLSVRGNFYNNWDMVYGMQFSENNFTVETTNAFSVAEDVNYKLASAQLSLLFSYKIIENHLSVEVGPLIQVNGELKIDSADENNIISGTTLLAKNITNISPVSFFPVAGITAGVRHFRLNVSYQYGVNNMLSNLDSKNPGYSFKGNPGILNGSLILYL